mmetsp:Transcript_28342/g.35044  ORF Transcript_28342/g.35044 Transcript_28342/m.35044 type:complete len:475 (+) Transcript_28342:112-1536(+)
MLDMPSEILSQIIFRDSPDNKSCRSSDWYFKYVNQSTSIDDDLMSENEEKISQRNHLLQQMTPRVPLNGMNKQIVSKVKPMNITYEEIPVKVSEKPLKRKRRKRKRSTSDDVGMRRVDAKDEHGNTNYLYDVTSLRRTPLDFVMVDRNAVCSIRDETWKLFTQKVTIDFAGHEAAERKAATEGKLRAKILCIVYTIEPYHDRIPPIRETWGSKCDGFFVGSNQTDPLLDILNIPHKNEETYGTIWSKVQAIWSNVYHHHYDDFDWFHIGGDDLYVLVENLRLYLESESVQLLENGGQYLPIGNELQQFPVALGLKLFENGKYSDQYNTGGPGYTLNKAALKALVLKSPKYLLHAITSGEDVMVSQSLKQSVALLPYDTRDELDQPRYHHFRPDSLYNMHDSESPYTMDWYKTFLRQPEIKEGLNCCSSKSVAFHYISSNLMKRMHAILYGYCGYSYLSEKMLIPKGLDELKNDL